MGGVIDMWDAHFDRGVERTRGRPIACGEVTQQQVSGREGESGRRNRGTGGGKGLRGGGSLM